MLKGLTRIINNVICYHGKAKNVRMFGFYKITCDVAACHHNLISDGMLSCEKSILENISDDNVAL